MNVAIDLKFDKGYSIFFFGANVTSKIQSNLYSTVPFGIKDETRQHFFINPVPVHSDLHITVTERLFNRKMAVAL